jgi:hypothetical protein
MQKINLNLWIRVEGINKKMKNVLNFPNVFVKKAKKKKGKEVNIV